MEKGIREEFSESVLLEALSRFGLEGCGAELIRSNHAFVYDVTGEEGSSYILRLSHERQKPLSLLEGEVHWMDYLASKGVKVCLPLENKRGRRIEQHDDLFALLYNKMGGQSYRLSKGHNTFYRDWGALQGQFHHYSPLYENQGYCHRGDDWHYEFLSPSKYAPKKFPWVQERLNEVRARIDESPRHADSWQLIHGDLHPGNFIEAEDGLWIFDFDDSHYDFIETDLAIALMLAIDFKELYPLRKTGIERAITLDKFCREYFSGYRIHRDPRIFRLDLLNDFMMRRLIVIFTNFYRSADVDSFSGIHREYYNIHERMIRDNEPFLSEEELAVVQRYASDDSV